MEYVLLSQPSFLLLKLNQDSYLKYDRLKWLTCPSGNEHETAVIEIDGSELPTFQ